MMTDANCQDSCDCTKQPQFSRRHLLQIAGACAGTLGLSHLGNAGLVLLDNDEQFHHLIPEDKGISKEWLASLVERGKPETYRGWDEQLKYIGMPIGGIACGQLYLGGDGRLWHWDIFTPQYQSDYGTMSKGIHYAGPLDPEAQSNEAPKQGFAIRVRQQGQQTLHSVDRQGFEDISFEGIYPIGNVNYASEQSPIEVSLEAFSPFCPLDAQDSALPCTVLNYTVRNSSEHPIEADLVGWLENAVCPLENQSPTLIRRVRTQNGEVVCDAYAAKSADDSKTLPANALEQIPGFGTMSLRCLGEAAVSIPLSPGFVDTESLFKDFVQAESEGRQSTVETDARQRPAGAVGYTLRLAPGESTEVSFVLSWHFPHFPQVKGEMAKVKGLKELKRHYAARFEDSREVADYVAMNFSRLASRTRLWSKTWRDSALPYWLLGRVMAAIDCMATTTLYWFDSGRVWAWEGTDCCPGTCQHVWNYSQGMARLFPELERTLRRDTDFGFAWRKDGATDYRGESGRRVAHDGHCGTIMRVWREHAMSADDSFLRAVWPRVKKSTQFLIDYDGDGNGLIEGTQYNTLDQAWNGPMAWISSLYLGALAAGEAMARELKDDEFADKCNAIIERGRSNLVDKLYDGEYFIHEPKNLEMTNSNKGCHIDQVLGQSWAIQYGLPRVITKEQTLSALQSLWKYNFAPDAGGYREQMQSTIKGGRIYATVGESGLLMTTWPKGGAEIATGTGRVFDYGVGYFNECMNGFEYQVAAHMIYEGKPGSDLVQKGLAITRAVHDRYSANKRNPYNEVECSDHYSRSMASYGVFLAVCGFEYDGPAGSIGFAPRISPENFRAPFTSAEGWGTLGQERADRSQTSYVEVVWGKLNLKQIALAVEDGFAVTQCNVSVDGITKASTFELESGRLVVTLNETLVIKCGSKLEIHLS